MGESQGGSVQQRRLWAVRGEGACSWLTARPSSTSGRLYLSQEDAGFSYRFWLGLSLGHLRQLGLADPCYADPILRDPHGWAVGRVHGQVQREVAAISEEADLPCWLEDEAAFGPRGSPDYLIPDIVIPDPDQGTIWAVDVATTSAQRAETCTPGGAVRRAERAKATAYAPACRRVPAYTAVPFGIDTFGGLGESARTLLGRLAERRLQAVQRDEDAGADTRLRHLFTQHVVLSLLRAQSHVLRRACMWRHQQADPSLGDDARHARRAGSLGLEAAGLADLATVVLPL